MNIKYYIHHPKGFFISLIKKINFLFPEKIYLKILFRLMMGRKLDLENPQTFSEKLQWLKLYNRKTEYTQMVDKYEAKEYVKGIIGEDYIIPTLGVWDKFDDIEFNRLPDKFVLKTTNGGGSCGVIICKNKKQLDLKEVKSKLQKSAESNIYKVLKEWPYKNIKSRFLAEKLIENEDGEELLDYKFFCFNGKPKYCQVIKNRRTNETIDFFDINWAHQEFVGLSPVYGDKFKGASTIIKKPYNYDKMIKIASELSVDIPFVRIDMYEVNCKVYFGEITFFPASGLGVFEPNEWNLNLGSLIKLPKKEEYV